MAKVGGAKHAAPKHARGARHAKHAQYTKRSYGIYYAAGAAFVAAALAIGIFAVPAFNQPQSVSVSNDTVALVEAGNAEATKASAQQSSTSEQVDSGKAEALEPESNAALEANSQDEASADSASSQTNAVASVQGEISATPEEAQPAESETAGEQSRESEEVAQQAFSEQSSDSTPANDSTSASDSAVDSDVNQSAAVDSADDVDQPLNSAASVEGDFAVDESVSSEDGSSEEGSPTEIVTNRAKELQAQSDENEIAFYASLLEDGATLDYETAEALAGQTVDYATHVKPILQEGLLDSGCEIVSLAIALGSMGVKADPVVIADEYLDFEGGIEEGYMGSPYYGGGGFPSGIAKAANQFLSDKGYTYTAHDLTGNSLQALVGLVERGYPVLVWVTINYEDPFLYNDTTDTAQWYANEHCVVMYGVADGKVKISDPLEGLVEHDIVEFADLYEHCGSMALIVR